MKNLVFLLPLMFLAGCGGCRQQAAIPGAGNSQWQQSNPQWQEELLTYAIENLNQMEKYQTQETFFGIFRQIYSLQEAAADKDKKKNIDTLSAAWPESEMFNQILDRLNQWVRSQPPPGDWKPDGLVETLPESLKELPMVKGLGSREFSAFDGYSLLEAAYLRDVALWVRGDALDDLSRAKNLFNWTIRNIQLEERRQRQDSPVSLGIAAFWPGYGHGTGLDFYSPGPAAGFGRGDFGLGRSGGKSARRRGKQGPCDHGASAVLIDGNAYLFDPLLGMPIPGKDGIRHDAQGRLELQPATLAEILADPSLLKRLDIDSQKTYPVKQADLRNLVALVEASPASLSYRMKLIESRLAGKQKMALTVSATAQAEHWKSVPGIGKTELWLVPYETIRRRSQLAPARYSRSIGRIHAVLRASGCAFGQGAFAAY